MPDHSRMSLRRRNHRSFTLLELLIVLAVISVLAALLLPALRNAQECARSITCLNNTRQIAAGFHSYASDNQDTFPPLNPYTTTPRTYNGVTYPGGIALQYGQWYVNRLAIYVPAGTWSSVSDERNGYVSLESGSNWVCPTLTAELYRHGGGYGVSENIIRYGYRGGAYRFSQVKRPSGVYLIGDAWEPGNATQPFCSSRSIWPSPEIGAAGGWATRNGRNSWDDGVEQSAQRHAGDKVQVSFYDGHAESRLFPDLKNNSRLVFSPDR